MGGNGNDFMGMGRNGNSKSRSAHVYYEHVDVWRSVATRCTDFVRLFLDLERPEVNEQNEWNYELCGNDTLSSLAQRRFYSSTPYLILEFHTDHQQTNNTGFRGVFNFIDTSKHTHTHTLVHTVDM